jgi:hypothetical protein
MKANPALPLVIEDNAGRFKKTDDALRVLVFRAE